eukprot:COSAG01_NODE_1441_length_10293_cov_4.232392_5_plen_74_part_00
MRAGVQCTHVDGCGDQGTEGHLSLSPPPFSRLQAGDCFGESCLLYMDDDAKVPHLLRPFGLGFACVLRVLVME